MPAEIQRPRTELILALIAMAAAGVSPNIVKVHEAVCAEFPDITNYGTLRGDGEHAQGHAVKLSLTPDS